MKLFSVFTALLLILYLLGFLKKKKSSMDFMDREFTTALKGFSILTVVWSHSGGKLNVGGIQFIAGIGVALFLICSGYGLEMSYQKNRLKGFIKKRLFKVCIPFWIVELFGLAATGRLTVSLYLKDVLFIDAATSYGWFMGYIVICYLIYYVLKLVIEHWRFDKKQEALIWLGVFAIWFVIEAIFPLKAAMPMLRARQMFAFPIGILIAKYKQSLTLFVTKKLNNIKILVTAVFTGFIFTIITQLSVIESAPFIIGNVLSLFSVVPLAIGVITAINMFPRLFQNDLMAVCGKYSYEIYLVHAFTLSIIQPNLLSIVFFILSTALLTWLLQFVETKTIFRIQS